MNTVWKNFLLARQVLADECNPISGATAGNIDSKSIYPLMHLSVLKVSGKDAGRFLQGQLTCNVNDLSATKSSFVAMCNPKGRAITTFLLVKKPDIFLLVLPTELLVTVQKKLQMYVLRSDVKIDDGSDEFCLFGLFEPGQGQAALLFAAESHKDSVTVHFSVSGVRKLIITDADTAMRLWSDYVDTKGFRQADVDEWCYFDILAGIPWVTAATSEEFVPQMLNLDKLGAISFNKGCYTGQEIVARTHYLGKNKRELYLAECDLAKPPESNSIVFKQVDENHEPSGHVLQARMNPNKPNNCKLLVVLQNTGAAFDILFLADNSQARLTLLPLTYD